MFGKKDENGVSMTFVLCMRPYAHRIEKHVKKGHLVKSSNCPFNYLMHNQASHTKQQNIPTNSNK